MFDLLRLVVALLIVELAGPASGAPPRHVEVDAIIQRSVTANQRDFAAAPNFNFKERDRAGNSTKTFQTTIIDGSPYQRLIAVNEKPLPPEQAEAESKKEEQAIAQRLAQTTDQRAARIANYEKERKRDQAMLSQLTEAFTFKLVATRVYDHRNIWVLKAVPKPGYRPPTMESQVLPGMEGELWIDEKTYEWVKVTAEVIRPVSIAGFLARVDPGTHFEIEKTPVGRGIWQISHFAMESRAKVLLLVNKNSGEEDWFYDFKPVARK
jgi:hypothetical protein